LRTRGAIVSTVPGRYEVVDLELDMPGRGEVMVRLVAAGLCHSDDHVATGDMPVRHLPMCGGHEGAGVVERVGEGVTGLEAGDHVVFSFLPICGECHWCSTGHQNLCRLGAGLADGSRVGEPGSYRMSRDGQPVAQLNGLAAFSEYTTVDVRSLVKIEKDIPLDVACLVGCGVITGWGSAVTSGGVRPGDVVIVMGIGGIGINAVQGAAHAGAVEVIAVDPIEFKRKVALDFGATSAFDTIGDATGYARSLTDGQGADCTVVTVGVTTGEHIAAGLTSIRKNGTLVVVGVGNIKSVGVPISPGELVLYQKRIQGSLFGAANPRSDIPRFLNLYRRGALKLDEIITSRYPLSEVATGYADMHAGKNLRGIITF
jgi:S-(hydroxymethyl)glutathione dehydrogenase/alcohol dehydrogenase